jgi:hypothetical protein
VRLPEALSRRLRVEAERSRRPATELAREAIERWLAEKQRASVHEAIALYAAAVADTTADVDPVLEAAAVQHLVEHDERAS